MLWYELQFSTRNFESFLFYCYYLRPLRKWHRKIINIIIQLHAEWPHTKSLNIIINASLLISKREGERESESDFFKNTVVMGNIKLSKPSSEVLKNHPLTFTRCLDPINMYMSHFVNFKKSIEAMVYTKLHYLKDFEHF